MSEPKKFFHARFLRVGHNHPEAEEGTRFRVEVSRRLPENWEDYRRVAHNLYITDDDHIVTDDPFTYICSAKPDTEEDRERIVAMYSKAARIRDRAQFADMV